MSVFLSKDENLRESNVFIGHLILKKINSSKARKTSIYSLYEHLNDHNIKSYRQILFGLLFLHSCNLIEFQYPYIEKK